MEAAAPFSIGLLLRSMAPNPRSAGLVIVRADDDGLRCLLLRAYRDWDFPKGEIEPGEAPLAAARREAAEEASLADLAFDWSDEHCDTAPYSQGKVARYFLARLVQGSVKLGINPELGRPEHHEFRWVTLDEARSLAAARLRPIIDWAATRLERPPAVNG